jgi:3-mercaptopropionate dioxygenase
MTTALIPTLAPTLAELVDRLDDAVRTPRSRLDVPHAVGEALRPFLGRPGLLTLEQETGDPDRYRTHLLHVPDDGAYSLVAAVWRPGQRTPVHDHIAWCVVGVHRGEEHEIRYRLVDHHLVEAGHTIGPCGEVTVLTPPGDIHAVVNDGTAVAASLHVYGADLRRRGTSVRRCYRLPVRGPAPR